MTRSTQKSISSRIWPAPDLAYDGFFLISQFVRAVSTDDQLIAEASYNVRELWQKMRRMYLLCSYLCLQI